MQPFEKMSRLSRELLDMRAYNLMKQVDALNNRAVTLQDQYAEFQDKTNELDTQISEMVQRVDALTAKLLQYYKDISVAK